MNRNENIISLINMYRNSHVLAGSKIVYEIDKLMTEDDDVLKGDNCVTFRQLVSDMLFDKAV
mgnify:CR=1 FL=1